MAARLVLPVIGATLIILGGVLLSMEITPWSVEDWYVVSIDAPPSLSWNLGIPRPQIPMAVAIDGDGRVGPVMTVPEGTFENVSGTGAVVLQYVSRATFPGPDPMQRPWGVNLTGRYSGALPIEAFWVRRSSANASAHLAILGVVHWNAQRLGDRIWCGGPGFQGNLTEGWNPVPELLGDCNRLIASPIPAELSIPLFAAGSGVLALAAWRARAAKRSA